MTAKEALKELVDRMSESEANAWLDRIVDEPDPTAPNPVDGDLYADDDPFSALIRSWMADDPTAEAQTLAEIEAAVAAADGVGFRHPPRW